MNINKTLLLTLIAILGTWLSFSIIDMMIISLTIGQYLLIELVVSIFHFLYVKVKKNNLKN
jgi:hypothetical protein